MSRKIHSIMKSAMLVLLFMSAGSAFGQVIFTSTPDSIAAINTLYNYQVVTTHAPNLPTYSLVTAPAGMTINSSSGLVSWTPTSMTSGGPVKIKAHNNAGDYYQSFNIYITDAVVCDTNIISYWPMDAKVGTSLPEITHGYNALWQGITEPEPTISSNGMVGNSVKFAPVNSQDWGYNVLDQDQYEFLYADGDFSVSLWFKNQASTINPKHNEVLIGRYAIPAGWDIRWNVNTSNVEFYMKDNSGEDTLLTKIKVINDENWHHVVATFDNMDKGGEVASYMRLYVDGETSVLPFDFYTDNFSGIGNLNIGWFDETAEAFSGELDEVTIWKKVLSQSEVNTLRAEGLAGQPVCQAGKIAPIITSVPVTAATQNDAYSYTLTYRTISGGSATLSAPVLPAWLGFNTNTGVLSGTPTNDNVGNHDVTLRVTSDGLDIDQTFTIIVANVNDAPEFTSTAVTTVVSKQPYAYNITTKDVDSQPVTLTCPTKPAWLTFTPNNGNGTLSGTPTRDDVGTADVVLQATDGIATTNQTFSIEVTLDNHVPEITSVPAAEGTVDVLYTYTLTATDQDGDPLTYRSISKPSWLAFSTSTHILSGIPSSSNIGDHSVELAVSDGKDEVTLPFTISVVATGISDNAGSLAKVYPVPASDHVVFEFGERLTKADLQIFSTSGKLLRKLDVSNMESYSLDVTSMKPNNYLYRITSSKGLQNGAIIVK
jgi:hypothetical protein